VPTFQACRAEHLEIKGPMQRFLATTTACASSGRCCLVLGDVAGCGWRLPQRTAASTPRCMCTWSPTLPCSWPLKATNLHGSSQRASCSDGSVAGRQREMALFSR